ncbi:hypothetical protein K488DRAFT_86270 [Vararia minispora EC-137]|uniref:Uncharacterized protein n=1 Tax=Vararia minispora EC-137 TaxID=1314806 RepID=A0ACB8QJK9_9AGAM|nr:hypothetical protein K488DRAFT_86270 [Vararia minispora EC-137]
MGTSPSVLASLPSMQHDSVTKLEEGLLGSQHADLPVLDKKDRNFSKTEEATPDEQPQGPTRQEGHDSPEETEPGMAIAHYTRRAGAAEDPTREQDFSKFTDSFWSLYLTEAEKEDAMLVESWKGDTDGILIFTGLFAATVATFLAQTYQLLSPPASSGATDAILLQVSQQIAGLANGTQLPAYSSTTVAFDPPFYAIWVNALWFLSLFLSIASALMATLMQQWTRRYLRAALHRSIPYLRGPIHASLRQGTQRFGLGRVVGVIVALLHLAVCLFFAGLLGFLFNLNTIVALVVLSATVVLIFFYALATILPLIFVEAPYDTPVTAPLHFCRLALLKPLQRMLDAIWSFYVNLSYHPFDEDIIWRASERMAELYDRMSRSREDNLQDRRHSYIKTGGAVYAMHQILKNINEYREIHMLLDAFIFFHKNTKTFGHTTTTVALDRLFNDGKLGHKISTLVSSCMSPSLRDSGEEPVQVRVERMHSVLTFFCLPEVVRFVRRNAVQPPCWVEASEFRANTDSSESISFLGRLLFAYARLYPRAFSIHEEGTQDAQIEDKAFGWDEESSTEQPQCSLVDFREYMCDILDYASLNIPNNPIFMYRALWEPILDEMKDAVIGSLRDDPILTFDVALFALLDDAGLNHLISPSPQLTSAFPAKRKLPDYTRVFREHRVLVDALHDVAEARLVFLGFLESDSLHSDPEPQPKNEVDPGRVPVQEPPSPITEMEEAPAVIVTGASVSSGPLTWRGGRPVDE